MIRIPRLGRSNRPAVHVNALRVPARAAIVLWGLALVAAPRLADPAEAIGRGDEFIWVIPSLSAPSVKNGGGLTISAVVKAAAGVERIEATIREAEGEAPKTLATVALRPSAAKLGGVAMDGRFGLWSAEWTGRHLEEKPYRVTLAVTDRAGRVLKDDSLTFTDPTAGATAPGTTNYPNGGLRRNSALGGLAGSFRSAVIDAAAGYAYFGTYGPPGMVIKVALGGTGAPTLVGALTLNAGEDYLMAGAIDAAGGHAYFGTATTPGMVVKVALGGAGTPTRVGALTLNTGEDYVQSAVIDAAAGYAYVGTDTAPATVVKVALGGAGAPTRVGAVTLNAGENSLYSAVIDAAAGYAYFGTNSVPGIVVKVALGGAGAPTRVGAASLSAGENQLWSAALDAAAGYAYFGTNTSPGSVVKVALGGAGAPTRVGALTLNAGENQLEAAALDPAAGFAWFGTNTIPGAVVKVALGGAGAPTRVGALTMNTGENKLKAVAMDGAAGYAYFGTATSPGIVVKAGISENGVLKATDMTMPETGAVDDVNFYSHAAQGNVRLAIYRDAAPRVKLWESGSLANTVAGGFVTVPISAGTPASLTLGPGNYQLAWQVDTNAAAPSYALGAASEGLSIERPYGAFPADLNSLAPTSTTERWTMYINYTAPNAAGDWSVFE